MLNDVLKRERGATKPPRPLLDPSLNIDRNLENLLLSKIVSLSFRKGEQLIMGVFEKAKDLKVELQGILRGRGVRN